MTKEVNEETKEELIKHSILTKELKIITSLKNKTLTKEQREFFKAQRMYPNSESEKYLNQIEDTIFLKTPTRYRIKKNYSQRRKSL